MAVSATSTAGGGTTMESMLSKGKTLAVFLLGRYPFFNAAMLLMVLAERAVADNYKPPFHVELLYAFVILMVLLGIGMSYELRRTECSLLFVCQLGYMAFSLYTNEKLKYKPWLMNRLLVRCVGLAGVYVIFAFLTSQNKSKRLQKIGEGLLAVFTMSYMFMLVNGTEERDLFVSRIPFGNGSLYFLVTVMGACAMIYINGGLFVTDAAQAMMCITLSLLMVLYLDFNYWVNKKGVPYWVHVKIVADDAFICIGLFLMAFAKIYWNKRLPKEDKDGNFYHTD